MAAATASEPTTQLARLGLSEEEFKEKTELMRLYLQDNSGATSFDDFCRRRPDRTSRTNDQIRPTPVEKKPPSEPAKSTINANQKAFNGLPMFPPVGLPMPTAPLNPQMFGMMSGPQVSLRNIWDISLHFRVLFYHTRFWFLSSNLKADCESHFVATTSRASPIDARRNAYARHDSRPSSLLLPSHVV